ncbi:MAG TPA: NAD-dependent deacylase [Candidatus Acidoferrales bacterium]
MSATPTPHAGERLAEARQILARAKSIAVLTGAGISAESGLPTFRGPGGLWRNFRPEDLATPHAFARDPAIVWEWYNWRRSVHAQCAPNAGHAALAQLEQRTEAFLLITQNVDSLHERAGSRNVIHLHGSLWRVRCLECHVESPNQDVPLTPVPPRCDCGGMLRPAVVWFGEPLPPDLLRIAADAAQAAEAFLVVGTSGMVYPAAQLPQIALESGARIIEVNPEETPLSQHSSVFLRGAAGEILPQVV